MQDIIDRKKEIIRFFLDKKILLSSDMLTDLQQIDDPDDLYRFVQERSADNMLVLSKDAQVIMQTSDSDPNWAEFERSKMLSEKSKNNVYEKILGREQKKDEIVYDKEYYDKECPVKILVSYQDEVKKRDVQDFTQYFNARYQALKKILSNRQELANANSINRLSMKKEKDTVSIIAMIADKQITKNNSIILTLEDPTGKIKAILNKNKPEVFTIAKDLVNDEIIGVTGTFDNGAIFINSILFPDVPFSKELRKSPDEAYALILSDIHIGSKLFLKEEFERMLSWLRGEVGSDQQRDVANKVKYVFIVGDAIDGVGVYPRQEDELTIVDIYKQYEELARYLRTIPQGKMIIMCPGNHDAVRIAEPQPEFDKEFAKVLWDVPNLVLVSNPAMVNIHAKNGFPGFDVLMYHGFSFSYYGDNIETIRVQRPGISDRVDLIMKFLMQRRHLAPAHTSTQLIPDSRYDPLVIEKVPDIFLSGHIHKAAVTTYKNVSLVSSSCWQETTPYQIKLGHTPEPAKIPLINLQTREVKILKFGK